MPIEKNSKFEISRMIASKNKDSDFQKITKAKMFWTNTVNNKIDKIDLLKIDTQGFEPEVLKGLIICYRNKELK